jgi:hypothetical protein
LIQTEPGRSTRSSSYKGESQKSHRNVAGESQESRRNITSQDRIAGGRGPRQASERARARTCDIHLHSNLLVPCCIVRAMLGSQALRSRRGTAPGGHAAGSDLANPGAVQKLPAVEARVADGRLVDLDGTDDRIRQRIERKRCCSEQTLGRNARRGTGRRMGRATESGRGVSD